jgi:hypothetical protein
MSPARSESFEATVSDVMMTKFKGDFAKQHQLCKFLKIYLLYKVNAL